MWVFFQSQNCLLDGGVATLQQCPIVCNPSDATHTCRLCCNVDLAELCSCGYGVERWSGRSTYDPIIISVENTQLATWLQTAVCVKMAEEDGDSAQSGRRQRGRRGSLRSSPSGLASVSSPARSARKHTVREGTRWYVFLQCCPEFWKSVPFPKSFGQ
jgi:hypothetical protein